MTRDDHLLNGVSRRRFLRTAATTGAVVGLSTHVGAQEDDDVAKHFRFGGGIGAWQGRAPESIEGEENPTLNLEAGKRYRVTWKNLDGFPHNFVVLNEKGDELVRTEWLSEAGETQTLEFTASGNMTEYICEVHPRSMRGDVEVTGGAEGESEQVGPDIPKGPEIGLQRVAGGLAAPLALEEPENDANRRFVVDQTGQIYVLDGNGLREEPFLNIADRMVDLGVAELNGYDERGLLGLAFHPNFQQNRKFYVHYSAPVESATVSGETGTTETVTGNETDNTDPDEKTKTTTKTGGKGGKGGGNEPGYDHVSVIAEFTAADDLSRADPDSERRIIEILSPQMNHNGAALAFGPDGYLYFGIGDGGAANDVGAHHVPDWYPGNNGGNGQDITQNLLGSIMRIDVDNQEDGKNYAIPDDNPLVGEEGLDEQYAWGFRNPWGLTFTDGKLFVADAGQNLWEEVNIVEKGGNYGWNVKEATHCFSTESPNNPPPSCPDKSPRGEPLLDPIIEYRHRRSTTAMIDGSVVAGGYLYQNDTVSDLQGKYVFGNWSGSGIVNPDGEIFVAEPSDGDGLWSVTEAQIAGAANAKLNRYVYGFGRDQDGELYVLTSQSFRPAGDTGEVFKIVPSGEGDTISTGEETSEGTQTTAENETTTGNETTEGA